MKSLVIHGLRPGVALLKLANFADDEFGINRVHIHTIQALIKGGGREALNLICRNSSELGITLSLNACPFRTSFYAEPWGTTKLMSWYENFGFKRVVAKSDFYNNMDHLMVKYVS